MPIVLGKRNTLRVGRIVRQGAYLETESPGEVLLPAKWVPPEICPGESLEVFVYRDSEDRLVCTPQIPLVQVGECACLRAVSFQPGTGTFLDWGLEKDLLLPLREQTRPVRVNEEVLVYVFIDERSDRIVASMRLQRHLHLTPPRFYPGQSVPLLVTEESDLGYRCVVANSHFGVLYRSEVFCSLKIGERVQGHIREVRSDGKIDLRLGRAGYGRVEPLAERLQAALEAAGGHLEFHDKSDPVLVRQHFGCSKKAFKQALGSLLRERKIVLSERGISLVPKVASGTSIPGSDPEQSRA
jgi:predicted RNA-binding protein (virulence factor B family)